MKASEAISLLAGIVKEEGDIQLFTGDMVSLDASSLEVCDTVTIEPEERERYGDKYLHIGNW